MRSFPNVPFCTLKSIIPLQCIRFHIYFVQFEKFVFQIKWNVNENENEITKIHIKQSSNPTNSNIIRLPGG